MMLVLIFGTVAQKYIGLYAALDKYFYSWIIWAGPLPLPGGLVVMGAFFVNLMARFIGYSVWKREKAGIHLAHAGVILLLLGGIISGINRVDTVLPIAMNELARETQSYDQSALTIYKNNVRLDQYAIADLQDGQTINFDSLPFDINILNRCINCDIKIDRENGGMTLVDKAQEKDREQNLPGLVFETVNKADREKLRHISFLYFPKPPILNIDGDEYMLTVERIYTHLPFDIKLDNFKIDYHPGTSQARSYQSDITLISSDGHAVPAVISMNEPVSYQGYKLYQSAYQTDNRGNTISIIAVVYNQGRVFPYIAGLITALGLLMHLVFKIRGRISQSAIRFSAVLLFSFISIMPAHADINIGTSFDALPVLHEGRIKPIDSFARLNLKKLSGSEQPFADSPSQTLAHILFNPYDAVDLEIFQIKDKALLSKMGLMARHKNLYSYRQISKGLDETRDAFIEIIQQDNGTQNLSAYDNALTDLHSKALNFLQLVRTFSFAMPLEGSSEDTILDYKTLQQNTTLLRDALDAVRRGKGSDIESYTEEEKETAYLNYQLDVLEATGQTNLLFRVIPSSDPREKWVAPWQVLSSGKGSPASQNYMEEWVHLMIAFQAGHQEMWDRSIESLSTLYKTDADTDTLKAELFYNKVGFLFLSIALSFLTALVFVSKSFTGNEKLLQAGKALSISTCLCLVAMVLFRVFLLDRPPVGTLYESILFVCLIMALACVSFLRNSTHTANSIITFTMTGFLLLLAQSIDSTQDNLKMMEAVLNTNFWLATHVLIITAGYAWCLLTSGLAHVALYRNDTKTNLHTHAIISLFLIVTGTILGGIWADMSWGRFWGWDPKENGALLIALWLIWALHSLASKHLSETGFRISMAALSIVIMLSWFGVNLLNVGLHSYGFVEGLALALVGFIIFELGLISILVLRLKRT